MSKEELMSILGGYNLSMSQIEKAIDEYAQSNAKQQAIAFAAYTADNLWGHYKGQWYEHHNEDNPKTSDELYAQFVENQSQNK